MALVKKCRHDRAEWDSCACTWYADVRIAGKREYVNLGRHKVDARREYRALKLRLETGQTTPQTASEVAFDHLAERWLHQHERRVNDNTGHGYRMALAHAERWLDDTDVRSVTPAMLADMEGDLLSAGLAPSYVRQVRIVARMVLGYAADQGLIDEVPSMRRHRLPNTRAEPKFLEPSQVEAVIATMPAPFDRMTELDWLTGLRPGELVALQAGDVAGERLVIARTVHSRTGRIGPTKSRQTRRVDLSVRAHAAAAGIPFERSYTPWLRYWHDGLSRAGLPRCGLHALRHSNVALRVAAGQDVVYIADQLGHSTAAFTLKVYGHLLRRPDSEAWKLDETAARLVG